MTCEFFLTIHLDSSGISSIRGYLASAKMGRGYAIKREGTYPLRIVCCQFDPFDEFMYDQMQSWDGSSVLYCHMEVGYMTSRPFFFI
jgi:hypothetical protein